MMDAKMLKIFLDVQRDMNAMLNDRPLMERIEKQYREACRKYPLSEMTTDWIMRFTKPDPDAHLGAARG